ncbi:MAG: hypothetical protein M3Y56_04015 [Armatimonadota bacterium]|nr:hypothetical protein [Armatimonadota bacterium]
MKLRTLAFPVFALILLQASPSVAATRSVTDAPFNARPDMKMFEDAAIMGGSTALVSLSNVFTAPDVGKAIVIAGAGPNAGVLATTIRTVTGPHAATIGTAASTSVSKVRAAYGTDDTPAFQAALDAQGKGGGGEVSIPTGAFLLLGTLTLPRFVRLHGELMLASSLIGALPGNQFPGEGPMDGGTTLGMVEGFGDAAARPFLTVNTNAVVEGIAIYNPLQTNAENVPAPTPGPWAVDMIGNADRVSNVNLVNVYQGIRAWSGVRHWMDHITGSPPSRVSVWTTAGMWTGWSRFSSSRSSTTIQLSWAAPSVWAASGSGSSSMAPPSRLAGTINSG